MYGVCHYQTGYVMRSYLFASFGEANGFCQDTNKLKGVSYEKGLVPFLLEENEVASIYFAGGHAYLNSGELKSIYEEMNK